MNPLLIIAPLAAVGAGAVALRVHALNAQKVPIPGGTGTIVIPKTTNDRVTNVTISQLPPAIQQALSGPGAPVPQAQLNATAISIAQGDANPASFAKARNGAVFNPLASNIMQGLKAGDIQPGDSVTFDVGKAGLNISSIPGGSSIMLAQQASTGDSLSGIFIDGRVPENIPVTIPLNSVTGIAPAP